MSKFFGVLATVAAAALLIPYDAKVNSETNEWEARSLLLKMKFKNNTDENGNKNQRFTMNFAGVPTQSDIDTLKKNVSNAAAEGVKFAKETAEKVKTKFTQTAKDCGCGDGESDDFCSESEEAMF